MIILEGPDRAGKTTLGDLIANRHVSQKYHLGGSKIVRRQVVRHWGLVDAEMWRYAKYRDKNIVYDRMVIGSMVYAFKHDMHNIEPVTEAEYGAWLKWLTYTESLLICCLPPLDVILDRMQEGEAYIGTDEMILVYRSYQRIFNKFKNRGTSFMTLFYDSSVESAEQFYQAHQNSIKTGLGLL